jgi:hypothetical protein
LEQRFMADNNYLTRATVNNAGRDPIQGYDCDVYVLDQATGNQNMVGRFTSFQLTVRNATEPYMEFNQRIPRMLDGEFQFGWVLERGLIDTRVLEDTFGMKSLYREQRISRSPRWILTLDINAPELDESELYGTDAENLSEAESQISTGSITTSRVNRSAIGGYRLLYAKVDSLSLGATSGRNVVASRWEGLCEGIVYVEPKDVKTTGGLTLAKDQSAAFQTNENLRDIARGVSTLPTWVTAEQFGIKTTDVVTT